MKIRDFVAIIRKLYVWVTTQRLNPHMIQRIAHLNSQARSFQQSIQHFHFTCINHIHDAYSGGAARRCPLHYAAIPVISHQQHQERYLFQTNRNHRGNQGRAGSHDYFKISKKRHV